MTVKLVTPPDDSELFQTIPGRTTRRFVVDGGVVTVRNCGGPKIYVNVGFAPAPEYKKAPEPKRKR